MALGGWVLSHFFCHFFSKGNDFSDILFASLEESTVLKGSLLVKEQILLGPRRKSK